MPLLTKRLSRQRCPNGHLLGPYNRTPEGKCKTCRNLQKKMRRASKNPVVKNSEKTHCPYGHPYSGDNLAIIVRPGRRSGVISKSRVCRACKRARAMDRYWSVTKADHPGERGRPKKGVAP